MRFRLRVLVGLTLLLALSAAHALDLPDVPESLSLRGFGTLGGVYHVGDDAGFVRDRTQPDGPRGGEFSAEIDSRLGVQLNWNPHPDFEAMAQLVGKYRYDGSFRPQLTWAFLKYSLSPDLDVRVGRLGFDIYLNADSRDVGYSYLWIRPPVDFYGASYYSYINGFDLTASHPLGDAILKAKFFAGRLGETTPSFMETSYEVEGDLWGGYLEYQTLDWQLRVGLGVFSLENDYPFLAPLVSALRMTRQPEALRTADSLLLSKGQFVYYAAGLAYGKGAVRSQLGVSYLDSENDIYQDRYAAALSIGYRIGRWTPYLILSKTKSDHPRANTGLPDFGPLKTINDATDLAYGSGVVDQETIGLGARFDFAKNLALKFQADWVFSEDNPSILWVDPEPDWGRRATLLSMSLDFVF